MVPLMKCCLCGPSHEFQSPQGYILLFLSLTSKLSETGRVGMTKMKGRRVQFWVLFTDVHTEQQIQSHHGTQHNTFLKRCCSLGLNTQ